MKRFTFTIALLLAMELLFTPALASQEASLEGSAENAVAEIVNTDKGTIEGFAVEGSSGQTLHCYYGIPYAEAPVGELRWMDAQEKEPWDGVLDCTSAITDQNSSYQWGTNLLSYFLTLNESEDCLYLNVTTSASTSDDNLPVIVWFHGGGLFGGSGSEEVYNLTNLPEAGCIVVTVTMRLGAFGLLSADVLGSMEGQSDAGDYMISDMVAALQWVQNNIAAFGGDASNVTIAGESGGASKVSVLIASSKAAGLFTKAIMQSGAATAEDFVSAKEAGNQLMEALGVSTLEQAQAVPAEDVVAAYNELGLSSSFIVDGYYLADDPLASIENGDYNACTVMAGANSGELSNLLAGGIEKYLVILNSFTRDGNTAYAYEFDQIPSTWRALGFHCVHSMDLAYMFGAYNNASRFYDGGPWEQQFMFWDAGETLEQDAFIEPEMDEADMELSNLMIAMWVSFAATGDPSTDAVQWDAWTEDSEDYIVLTNMNGQTVHMETGYSSLA